MDRLVTAATWILIVGGLLWVYQGFTNVDLVDVLTGSLNSLIDIGIFGGAALILIYHLLTMRSKKK